MSTTPSTTPPPASPARSYLAFAVFIAVMGAFSSLVNDMYLPTMPAMQAEFHTTPSMTQLGLTMAMTGLAIGSLVWGSASDHFGRKPTLAWSIVIFSVATVVSIFSQSIEFFVICRLFQGFGVAGGMVLSTSIPADVYSGRKLVSIMALVGAINGFAPAVSPLLGGFMASWAGWRGIFVVLLVIGLLMLYFTRGFRETLPPARRVQGRSMKVYIQAYISLLRNRRFMLYVTIKAVTIGLLYAYVSSATFILQEHYGFTPLQFGLIFGGNALALVVGSALAMRFPNLKQALLVGIAGIIASGLGAAAVMLWEGAFVWYEVAAIPMLMFSGILFASSNTLSMEEGHADAGTASAILDVVKYIFAAVVAPVVGLGNMMHTTAWVTVVVLAMAGVLGVAVYRLSPLADMSK